MAARPDILDRLSEMIEHEDPDLQWAAVDALKDLLAQKVRIFHSQEEGFDIRSVEELSQLE